MIKNGVLGEIYLRNFIICDKEQEVHFVQINHFLCFFSRFTLFFINFAGDLEKRYS